MAAQRTVDQRTVDLNADVGEGGPVDAGLMEIVSSASIACGFHAGDPLTLQKTARLAAARGVAIGAHPSYRDREGMGRRDIEVPRPRLEAEIVYQVGAAAAAAVAAGSRLLYVKPHGALYNRAAVDEATADAVVAAVSSLGGLTVLGLAGSVLVRRALAAGVSARGEAFADRAYMPDGTLMPRSEAGAVITEPGRVVEQALQLVSDAAVRSLDGTRVEVQADSICVHGDTPGALDLAGAVRSALIGVGIEIRPFA